jgi:hypothetical protein
LPFVVNQFVDAKCLVLDKIESKDLKVHTKLAVLSIDYKKGDQVCHEQMALTPEKLSILLHGNTMFLSFLLTTLLNLYYLS